MAFFVGIPVYWGIEYVFNKINEKDIVWLEKKIHFQFKIKIKNKMFYAVKEKIK